MIDCHCHILPGIDDGARDMEHALAMARKAVASGITDIIATPHHLNGVYWNSRKSILKAVAILRIRLAEEDIPLNIFPGSELHLAPELLEQLEQGEAMTYADLGKAVLVEFPRHTIPTGSEQILENLFYQGLTPVVAHPERNSTLCEDRERVGEWVAQGCKLQLTTNSCAGDFGRPMQAVSRYWCERGWVHLIASDAHRTERRAPDMRAGAAKIEQWLGAEAARLMSVDNPKRLKNGEDLVSIEPVRFDRKIGRFSLFGRGRR
ncbi:MAG: CpsB/CapC family capsule biosynthesis tyrosine phosphatase [Pseudomonadota bacterium]|nr:CpsB/CapC family capsule biosynthesis tyrosine phosphatase [Pseudomonadota bacterium]